MNSGSAVEKVRDPEPILISATCAAALCGVSIRQWWRWDSGGATPRSVRIGSTKRWRREELLAWITAGCPSREEWQEMLQPESSV